MNVDEAVKEEWQRLIAERHLEHTQLRIVLPRNEALPHIRRWARKLGIAVVDKEKAP